MNRLVTPGPKHMEALEAFRLYGLVMATKDSLGYEAHDGMEFEDFLTANQITIPWSKE